MDTIKTGIIGGGMMGPLHTEALRRLGWVEVVAIAEANQELAEAKAKSLNIPKAYGDYKEMLEKQDLQVVHNCTPNNLHYQISKNVLQAGKHLVSEKPLAMDSTQSKELVELAKTKGVVNAIDFNYRFYPLIQQAKSMVGAGELGDIYLVHGNYLQDWLYLPTDYNWRVDPDKGGVSRAVADVGSHWCDCIQFITNSTIKRVYADLTTIHPLRKKPKGEVETYKTKELSFDEYEEIKITTEDCATLLMEFDNGVKGTLVISQVSAGRKNHFTWEIDGSKKALSWNQERPNELWVGYREKPNEIIIKDPSLLSEEAGKYAHVPGGHPEGYPVGLKNFLRNVYTHIKEGGEVNFSTFKDGHLEILITEAALESNKKKEWVEIKE